MIRSLPSLPEFPIRIPDLPVPGGENEEAETRGFGGRAHATRAVLGNYRMNRDFTKLPQGKW
jgi:hypothetical protein